VSPIHYSCYNHVTRMGRVPHTLITGKHVTLIIYNFVFYWLVTTKLSNTQADD